MEASRLRYLLSYDQHTGEFMWTGAGNRPAKRASTKPDTGSGYVRIKVDGRSYLRSRLAFLYMTGLMPADQIDHIDGNRSNDSWGNLRPATSSENAKNRKTPSNNTTGVIGLHWHKAVGKWYATIKVSQKPQYLGVFDDWFDAVCARKSAENKFNFHPNHGRTI